MTSLDSWGDIIAKQGDERIRKDDEFLKQLQEKMPEEIQSLKDRDNTYLIDQLMAARGSHDPRVVEEYDKYKEFVKAEVLQRMAHGRD